MKQIYNMEIINMPEEKYKQVQVLINTLNLEHTVHIKTEQESKNEEYLKG